MFKGKNYINGEWETTRETYANMNPATGEILGLFPETEDADVNKAVGVARETFLKWRKVLSRTIKKFKI